MPRPGVGGRRRWSSSGRSSPCESLSDLTARPAAASRPVAPSSCSPMVRPTLGMPRTSRRSPTGCGSAWTSTSSRHTSTATHPRWRWSHEPSPGDRGGACAAPAHRRLPPARGRAPGGRRAVGGAPGDRHLSAGTGPCGRRAVAEPGDAGPDRPCGPPLRVARGGSPRCPRATSRSSSPQVLARGTLRDQFAQQCHEQGLRLADGALATTLA